MKKTFGGDRIGSGSGFDVNLHEYGRSTQNKGYIVRTTMAAGTIVPIINEIGLRGDTWDFRLKLDGKTLPTVGPLFGSYKAMIDVYMCPIRLYQGRLHNNEWNLGNNMDKVKFPIFELKAPTINPATFTGDFANSQINASCILKHLGLAGIGGKNNLSDGIRSFNALAW